MLFLHFCYSIGLENVGFSWLQCAPSPPAVTASGMLVLSCLHVEERCEKGIMKICEHRKIFCGRRFMKLFRCDGKRDAQGMCIQDLYLNNRQVLTHHWASLSVRQET